MPERTLDSHIAQWSIQALVRLAGTYAFVQGLGILIGGDTRWGSKALQLALSAPGGTATWGVSLAALGALLVIFTFIPTAKVQVTVCCVLVGAWALFFGSSLGPTVYTPGSTVATTGPPSYLHQAIEMGVLGAAYWKSRKNAAPST